MKIAVEGGIKREDFLDGQRLAQFLSSLRSRVFRPIALNASRVKNPPFRNFVIPLEFLKLLLGDEGIGINTLHTLNFVTDALDTLVAAGIHHYECG